MRQIKIDNYIVFEDGIVFNKYGKQLKIRKQIRLNDKFVSYGRFIYWAFNQDFDINDYTNVIVKINKNKGYELSNLKVIKEKDIKQGENNGYAKLTNDEVEEIKKRYNTTSCTYRSLARDFGVSHSLIGGIIKGNFRNKENYILK